MTQLIPYVGMSGVWGVDPLLAHYVRSDTIYTCQAVRSLIEMIELQADPLNSIYRALNLPQSQYESDLQNSVMVVSLVDSLGNWRYVPTSLITALPNVNGVLYQSYAIELDVDPLPSHLSLDTLSEELRELASARLGVDVQVSYRANAPSTLVDEASAKARETIRLTNINEDFSASVQVRILQERVRVLENLLNKMLGCFKSNCQSGIGLVIPIAYERTPGQSGYIDASDLVLDRPIIASNAIDLILYAHNGSVSTRTVIQSGAMIDSAGSRGRIEAGDYLNLPNQIAMSAVDLYLHSAALDPQAWRVRYNIYTSGIINGQSTAADYLLDAPRVFSDAGSYYVYGLYQDERNPLLRITLHDR